MPKDAILPQVRVPLELRKVAEAALRENESLSELVETAVRAEVRRRAMRAEFLAEGHAAVAAYEQDGRAVDADDLVERLQRKLDKAVAKRGKARA